MGRVVTGLVEEEAAVFEASASKGGMTAAVDR